MTSEGFLFTALRGNISAESITHRICKPLQIRCVIVVGYQTTEAASTGVMKLGEKNTMAPTFLTVGAQNVRLGDIKLSNVTAGNSTLQFINAYGATDTVTPEMIGQEAFEAFGAVDAVFTYATPEEAAQYEIPGGWYLPDDWNGAGAYPMNEVTLKKGQGFILEANEDGMTITYAGAVDPGEEGEVALPYNLGEKNVLGNVTPVNLILGDLVFGNVTAGNSTLQFINAYGATDTVTPEMIGQEAFEAFGAVDAVFTFATPEEAAQYEIPGGWYLPDDWNGAGAYPMNNIPLPAGKACVIEANEEGMTITLPSALAPKAN